MSKLVNEGLEEDQIIEKVVNKIFTEQDVLAQIDYHLKHNVMLTPKYET